MAFLCESLLMGLHKKHTPLDIAVHSVLFYTMLATAVLILLEAIRPRSFLLSCGRVAAVFTQGAWFLAAAGIMFTGAWGSAFGCDSISHVRGETSSRCTWITIARQQCTWNK